MSSSQNEHNLEGGGGVLENEQGQAKEGGRGGSKLGNLERM